MKNRKPDFSVSDAPRPLPPGAAPGLPLVTVAWRALRAGHQKRADDQREIEREAARTREILVQLAEEVWRLHAASGDMPATEGSARRLASILSEAGIVAAAPVGVPFTGELMDLFENIAQRSIAGLESPEVAEVVRPAILCRGAVLRMGKIVVAVPARKGE